MLLPSCEGTHQTEGILNAEEIRSINDSIPAGSCGNSNHSSPTNRGSSSDNGFTERKNSSNPPGKSVCGSSDRGISSLGSGGESGSLSGADRVTGFGSETGGDDIIELCDCHNMG